MTTWTMWRRPSVVTTLNLSLTVCCWLLVPSLAYSIAGEGWFDIFDLNHDGLLDKTEYNQGLVKLDAFLHQPLSSNATSTASAAVLLDSLSNFRLSDISLVGFWKAFTSAFAMILATEIGDKTFFIAAVLSMRHDRLAVFGGAILALIIMTILSTAMGLVLPRFMPRKYTHLLGGALFLYFGARLLIDSQSMEAGRASDELEEVEEELLQQSSKKADLEQGGAPSSSGSRHSPSKTSSTASYSNKHWYEVAFQALTLTFLAEWGDRSQIATIALGAAKNPYGVTIGGCIGHAVCTGLAVVGGRMLAARISEKTVSQWGGIIFVLFGIHSVFFEN